MCVYVIVIDYLYFSLLNWLGRVLGRGALSCVFRGNVGFLRTTVAIKRLDKEDKESSKAFCRELMIASSLHNPYVVPLLGFCIDPEEGLFLVYKYVSGGSLERYLHGLFSYSSKTWNHFSVSDDFRVIYDFTTHLQRRGGE